MKQNFMWTNFTKQSFSLHSTPKLSRKKQCFISPLENCNFEATEWIKALIFEIVSVSRCNAYNGCILGLQLKIWQKETYKFTFRTSKKLNQKVTNVHFLTKFPTFRREYISGYKSTTKNQNSGHKKLYVFHRKHIFSMHCLYSTRTS